MSWYEALSEHFPVLLVVLPLVAAPVCLLLHSGKLAHGLATVVSWLVLGMAVVLVGRVLAEGTVSYWLGEWEPPLGIEYRLDRTNAFVALIVAMIAAVVVPFGHNPKGEIVPDGKAHLVYASYMACMAGLLGMSVTGDLFNVYVFLEISSLSAYTLIGLGAGRKAALSAFTYLIMGTIGGTLFLIGVGLLYQMTGTLNMADLAALLPDVVDARPRTLYVAFVVMFVGLAIKLAVFPLHQWLPNAYTHAPPKVSAFLAATATKVAFYVIARIVFTLFRRDVAFDLLRLDLPLVPMALAAMFIGSTAAIFQTNVKRLLAYSSIAQIGYMTLGLALNSVNGLTGALVHLFNHALLKGGLFLVVACVVFRTGSARIADMRGLGRRMPLTMFAFVIGGLGLIGVPGTVGFVSKWYLVTGALEKEGGVLLAALILLSSLLAVVYVWRVVEVAYFEEPDEQHRGVREAPISMLIPVWVLIGASLYFGIFTEHSAAIAEAGARQLMGLVQ